MLDLTLFQFDFDLSFAMFFMNADKTIYGRYGTRSSIEDAESHMSLDGLVAALEGALTLHKGYPDNQSVLTGKQAAPTKYKTPNDFPSLRGKFGYELDYGERVVQSCLHCHQMIEAERLVYRNEKKPIPEKLLYPHPLPQTIGLRMDVDTRATVKAVLPNSEADGAGIEPGDVLVALDDQAILSVADIQWALHNAPNSGVISVTVERGNSYLKLEIKLDTLWRKKNDISWRVTSWDLRRMGTGGLVFEPVTTIQKTQLGIPSDKLALRVKYVGLYGAHSVAKRAGVKLGDVLVACDEKDDHWTTTQLLGYLTKKHKPGDLVPMEFLRNGQRIRVQIRQQ